MNSSYILKVIRSFVFVVNVSFAYAQQGQTTINRVEQMPDLPQPYLMRNWKEVAHQYDNFIYDISKTGEHLPVVGLKTSGYNYPSLQPILLDTYVGTNSSPQAEAINIIPSIVGASLVGIDKANQNGINWVEKAKDFFNSKNNQHVYLNGYNASSGNDWWYDLMPNIFFYQLSALYDDTDFQDQLISVADQWLNSVNTMGASTTPWTTPSMNYRAWRLSTMTGNSEGVHEPEAAGAIAWILYNAFIETGEQKYLTGAEHALEFLSSLTANPSYELQLPYGTLTAAKLNAIYGSKYNVDKMINWSFDRGALRGWGTIVGTWDGKDVSGLIGEANDNGNDYAFLMNGYQQAAAFAPLIKYDKRYARDISKWILNLANASRLLYPKYLDPTRQDDHAWSAQHDPQSVIAYEALKENWEGKALYGTGDAKRSGWAATNLGLYGSSHVGYLAAIVDTTNVPGILQLDLNATDFFGDNRYPSFALYNPHSTIKSVSINLGNTNVDVYDAISEIVIGNDVSGDYSIDINGGEVILIAVLPAGAMLTTQDNKLMYDGFVVDYHYGYDFNPRLRIKSLATEQEAYEFNEDVYFFATVDNISEPASFSWFVDGTLAATTTTPEWLWVTPQEERIYTITVEVTSGDQMVSSAISVQISAIVPKPPVIDDVGTDKVFYYENETAAIVCHVPESDSEMVTYDWQVSGGTYDQIDSLILWRSDVEGLFSITCTVTNNHGLSSIHTIMVLVKNNTDSALEPLAFFPLNINVDDYSGNDHHATVSGTGEARDAGGRENSAVRIASTDDILYVPNGASLNFADQITVACWVNFNATGREAFVLSHGSWEERWKISVTPAMKLRWTVKTNEGVKDLDSREAITPGQFYHVTASYNGYAMELYLNGVLDTFVSHNGSMLTTSKAISFGQKTVDETDYFLNGTIDEVRIYNQSLHPQQILTLKDTWVDEIATGLEEQLPENITAFPNPVGEFVILSLPIDKIKRIRIITSDGRTSNASFEKSKEQTVVNLTGFPVGVVILEVISVCGVQHVKLFIR